jgi:ribonuclease HIII
VPAAKYALKNPNARQQFKIGLRNLAGVQWVEKTEQYCDYRLDGESDSGWLRAKQFTNGTLYLEANDETSLARMTALLDVAPQEQKASASSSKTAAPSLKTKKSGLIDIQGPYIGTDESGKGDYFGPLVVAGAYVNEETSAALLQLGVMDSKQLTDAKIGGMYNHIIDIIGEDAIEAVVMGPAKYNELYQRLKTKGKNLNHLLAWGHAVVMEKLLGRHPECTQAIADQFGDERYILTQLKEKGTTIKLYQTPRAEANIGVATASVIARYRFTQKVKQLSRQFGVELPFGANPVVKTRAREFIAKYGKEQLAEVAKLHFKTTNEL